MLIESGNSNTRLVRLWFNIGGGWCMFGIAFVLYGLLGTLRIHYGGFTGKLKDDRCWKGYWTGRVSRWRDN
jgi:hypothetical protein